MRVKYYLQAPSHQPHPGYAWPATPPKCPRRARNCSVVGTWTGSSDVTSSSGGDDRRPQRLNGLADLIEGGEQPGEFALGDDVH
jgi:hypothetical protein